MEKVCTTCERAKPSSSFCKDRKARDGFSSRCKACAVACVKKHREEPEYRKRQQVWNEAWRSQNKEKVLIIRRKSQKKIHQTLKVAGFVTKDIRDRILERDGYACLRCGATTSLTIDHVVAISKGGITEDENLQTLCRSCNSQKQSLTTCYRKAIVQSQGDRGLHPIRLGGGRWSALTPFRTEALTTNLRVPVEILAAALRLSALARRRCE